MSRPTRSRYNWSASQSPLWSDRSPSIVSLRSASSDGPEYNPPLNQPGFPAELLDGNIRLAILLTISEPDVRQYIEHRTLPELDEQPRRITVAVFPDRRQAWPHMFRHSISQPWTFQQWTHVIDECLQLSYSYEEMARLSSSNASGIAGIHEAELAFQQLNSIHEDRWKTPHTSSYQLHKVLRHWNIRNALGMETRPPMQPNYAPMPQEEPYPDAQRELMDWIYGSPDASGQLKHPLAVGEYQNLHRLYEEAACLQDFRQRGHLFNTVEEFVRDHKKTPTLSEARDMVARLRYHADRNFTDAIYKLDISEAERRLIMVTNVIYTIDEHRNSQFVVELASKFPDRHMPVLQHLQNSLQTIQPNCVVRFW